LLIIASAAVGGILMRVFSPWVGLPFALVTVALILLFRDPERSVPSKPLSVLAPVDGRVLRVTPTDKGLLRREAMLIEIRVNPLGAYTMRSPVEGKVYDPRDNIGAGSRLSGRSGLWIHTDEEDDVVVCFAGLPGIGHPKAFVGYGERLGHGQRCAFLRLTQRCEVYLPASARVRVDPGDTVKAGVTTIAELSHKV
jgi:phosphatidylserine decarboxylase